MKAGPESCLKALEERKGGGDFRGCQSPNLKLNWPGILEIAADCSGSSEWEFQGQRRSGAWKSRAREQDRQREMLIQDTANCLPSLPLGTVDLL